MQHTHTEGRMFIMLILTKPKPRLYKQLIVVILCLLPLVLYFIYPDYSGKTILILGDSLSTAYGIGPKDSWVFLLQERLDHEKYHYRVINASIAGDTTDGGLKRLPQALKHAQPTLTIIALGANDTIQNIPIATIRGNLLKLIQLTKAANSKVLLLGMRAPFSEDVEYATAFQNIYPDLAKQEHIYLVPHFLKAVGNQSHLMQADKLHPVKDAQPIMLENVWPTIRELLEQP